MFLQLPLADVQPLHQLLVVADCSLHLHLQQLFIVGEVVDLLVQLVHLALEVVPHLLHPLGELLFLGLQRFLIDLAPREELELLRVLLLLEVHQLDQSLPFVLGDLQLLPKQE